ncbi:hypothetical protein TIFTF001_023183 [Ficus carica]|uniref:Retrotransposon gag domain-containing protein n=1 Tax=Ficus carica TaxID=3494 RepID=A0AA88ALD8_FICCA|nr:hypothetical protein TIFTF001_023183 [Ficus carica]
MAEQDNQDFHDVDDLAPTGSRGTQRTQRGRGARTRQRPSQTEILAGNEPPEVAESTPSRPPRSGSRQRNPSPTGSRGNHRTRRESPRRQPQEWAEQSRVRSRSCHSQATRSVAAEPPAVTGGNPDDRRRETVNVRGNTTSVFDRLGRPGVHQRIGRERFVDKPAKDEDYNQNRLDQLQRQLDQLVGQQFKMPSVAPYDDYTDADEHIENYQAHMLIQNANEAALCKSFCLTLTGAARQWYRRLAPGSIGCFKQLADAFAAAFLSSKTRKLGASHLFGIKQGETEALKKYLERFDKAVVQVESCTNETLMQAFREGIKDARLVWTLAYDRPPTFAQLRGIAWRHTEADEYVRGRELVAGEHPQLPGRKSEKNQADQGRQDKGKAVVVTGRGLLRDPPPLRADRARRNQNKYCNFHKDVGHDTKDCIQLRDQIELLIRDGHLREFVERIITPTGPSRPAQAARRNPRPSDQTDEQEQEHIVHTIFGGTATGDTTSSRRSYVCEARRYARGKYINMAEHISKIYRQDSAPITFTHDEADRLLHPHNDALIGEIRVAGNVIRRVLIDNGSSADIMFMDAFSRLKIEGAALTPARTPLPIEHRAGGGPLFRERHDLDGPDCPLPRRVPTAREQGRSPEVRSYDRAPTRIGHAQPGPTCPHRHPNLCGSRTTEFGLMTGHRPELDVPDQDLLPLQASQPVVLGPQS